MSVEQKIKSMETKINTLEAKVDVLLNVISRLRLNGRSIFSEEEIMVLKNIK